MPDGRFSGAWMIQSWVAGGHSHRTISESSRGWQPAPRPNGCSDARSAAAASVACLADPAGVRPIAISQHLAKLRLAGLVNGRREGTFVYYSAVPEHAAELLNQALFHADHVDCGFSHDASR